MSHAAKVKIICLNEPVLKNYYACFDELSQISVTWLDKTIKSLSMTLMK